MRDDPELMIKFVKIVERHPEVYDSTADCYKMRLPQSIAWAKIAACVKNELNEDCTADELKLKWKGIRSSLTRFLSKLIRADSSRPFKKYYLYDSLRFLHPFVNAKSAPEEVQFLPEDEAISDCIEFDEEDIKPDIVFESDEKPDSNNFIDQNQVTSPCDDKKNETCKSIVAKKRCYDREDEEGGNIDEENDLMLFFRSIVPDLKHFTPKEKRRFKMGILGLVDVIEDERRHGKSCNVVSSS